MAERGYMEKKGILFQGLIPEDKETDVTYFLLFTLCRNLWCRSKVREMKREWREYLIEKAEDSPCQGENFWLSLGEEEGRCAKVILGIVEGIRRGEEESREKSRVCLEYLLFHCCQREWKFLKERRSVSIRELCFLESGYADCPFAGVSRICAGLLIAEFLGVEVEQGSSYSVLLKCVREGNEIWNERKFLTFPKSMLYFLKNYNFKPMNKRSR